MTKILYKIGEKQTLPQFERDSGLVKGVQDCANILDVLFRVSAENDYIFNIELILFPVIPSEDYIERSIKAVWGTCELNGMRRY